MFMLESEDQPAVFSSIPAAMWWAIETLTTVGYGDMVPVTVFGRIIGGAVSIVGIGTLALFSGLITVGFLDQLKIHREQHPKMAVAISRETITVTKRYEGPAGDGEILPANCPHCGGTLTRTTLGLEKPQRAARRVSLFGSDRFGDQFFEITCRGIINLDAAGADIEVGP